MVNISSPALTMNFHNKSPECKPTAELTTACHKASYDVVAKWTDEPNMENCVFYFTGERKRQRRR
jgi:hypothetical protein